MDNIIYKYKGVEVDYIPFDEKGFIDPDEFPKKFKENTSLVIVNHASNVIGTIQPVKEIGKYCRKRGIRGCIGKPLQIYKKGQSA